jgi:hypothetical protein
VVIGVGVDVEHLPARTQEGGELAVAPLREVGHRLEDPEGRAASDR